MSAPGLHGEPPDSTHALATARQLADTVLRPAAEHTDTHGVPADHLSALARAGLLGLTVSAPPALAREVAEVLAGACLSSWFVAAQHATPLRMVAALPPDHPARQRWLADLISGRVLAGVAFSHLRARPRRPVTAVIRGDGAVRFDGSAPWYTGWGLSQLALVAGLTSQDEVVYAFLPAQDGEGVLAGPPLPLAAIAGTHTVALSFDGAVAPAAHVLARMPYPDWARRDQEMTANVSPAVFGIAREALTELSRDGHRQHMAPLAAAIGRVRDQAYGLLDDAEPGARLDERVAARATALELVSRATTALVVASGGRGMGLDHRAQRLAREALFLTVQAQTPQIREATLALLGQVRPRTD